MRNCIDRASDQQIGVRGLPHEVAFAKHIDANLLPDVGFCSTLGTDPQILQGLAGHGLGKCHGAELLLPLKMVFSIVCLILYFLSSFLPGSCGTCNVCCLHPRPLERRSATCSTLLQCQVLSRQIPSMQNVRPRSLKHDRQQCMQPPAAQTSGSTHQSPVKTWDLPQLRQA